MNADLWSRLSARERQVVRSFVEHAGRGKEVAHELGIAHATVRNHSVNISRKLETQGMVESMQVLGLISTPTLPGRPWDPHAFARVSR